MTTHKWLQVLQKKFDDFKRDVSASTERYSAANNLARRLVAEGHSDTVLIKEKQDAMRYELATQSALYQQLKAQISSQIPNYTVEILILIILAPIYIQLKRLIDRVCIILRDQSCGGMFIARPTLVYKIHNHVIGYNIRPVLVENMFLVTCPHAV